MKPEKIFAIIFLVLGCVFAIQFFREWVSLDSTGDAAWNRSVPMYTDLGSLVTREYLYKLSVEDSVLGAPYLLYPVKTGKFNATLIEYPFGSSPRTVKDSVSETVPEDSSVVNETRKIKGAVIYMHGLNDYFYQTELAEKSDSAGYAFFAVDLHNYGRSYKKGDLRCNMFDIREFYGELDIAISMVRRIVGEYTPIVFIGHSQGGLFWPLYLNDRPDANFAAVVLNSPFLEMNFPAFLRKTAIPLLAYAGHYFPNISIGSTGNTHSAYAVHVSGIGEWNYDLRLKPFVRPPTYLSWVNAIHRGHEHLHGGLNLKMPVLVMQSDCSVNKSVWDEAYTHCDGVLDVELIREMSSKLGPNVTDVEIAGGMHDLFLSKKPVRDAAYDAAFKFIDESLVGSRQ